MVIKKATTVQNLVDITPTEKIKWVGPKIDTRGRNIPVWSSGGGGGGSSGGTTTPEPEPKKPAAGSSYEEPSPGAKKALEKKEAKQPLTAVEMTALSQYEIRKAARERNVNLGELTEAGEKKFISGLVAESKQQEKDFQPLQQNIVATRELTSDLIQTPSFPRRESRTDIMPSYKGDIDLSGYTNRKTYDFTIPFSTETYKPSSGTIEGMNIPIQESAFIGPKSEIQPAFIPSGETMGLGSQVKRFFERERSEAHARKARGGGFDLRGELVGGFGAGLVASGVSTFEFGKGIITSPVETGVGFIASIPRIPFAIRAGIQKIVEEPSFALGYATGELATIKGAGKVISKGRTGFEIGITKLDPRFTPTIQDISGLRKIRATETTPEIPFAPSPISLAAEPPSMGIQRAGQTIDVVSAQTSFPFGELSKELFFDPKGRLRVSRLDVGAQKEASFMDLFSGEVTFRRGKPQALLGRFEVDIPPQKLKAKIEREQPFTQQEMLEWKEFRETPTGKVKPVPKYPSQEPEVWFPAGEIITKEGTPAVTLIDSRKVRLVRTGIKTPTKETANLLMEFKQGSLSDTNKLVGNLAKETGFSKREIKGSLESFSSGKPEFKPFFPTGRLGSVFSPDISRPPKYPFKMDFGFPSFSGGKPSKPTKRPPVFSPPLKPPRMTGGFIGDLSSPISPPPKQPPVGPPPMPPKQLITEFKPPRESKRRRIPKGKLPSMKQKDMFQPYLRVFSPTPSLGDVIKFQEWGIRTPRTSQKLSRTGLVERGFFIPKSFGALGPYPIKQSKKKRKKNFIDLL